MTDEERRAFYKARGISIEKGAYVFSPSICPPCQEGNHESCEFFDDPHNDACPCQCDLNP